MPVKIAVVGLGHMGMLHLKKALAIESVRVVALIEKNREKLCHLREKFQIDCYENYVEIDKKIDGAIIATPATTHYEIAKFFLENGVHLFVEKPLAITYKEAEDLCNLAESKSVQLQVGFLERYNPALRQAIRMLEDPRYLEMRRMSPYTGRSLDVNVIMDLMVHDLDLLSSIKKEKVTFVSGKGVKFLSDTVDEAVAILGFEDDSVSVCTASRISIDKERSLKLVDKEKVIKVDFLNMTLTVASRNGCGLSLHCYEFEKKDLISEELEDFISSIEEGKEPIVKGRDTLNSIFLAEKITNSLC
ncbi:MAG: Gfo/Idh/MocA family oxidoreductase [Deltaproteobacteria bacterium]|nr:Gfo/Idh/MocA family oxidoreductase [Deltaproteobacteria bacterium]